MPHGGRLVFRGMVKNSREKIYTVERNNTARREARFGILETPVTPGKHSSLVSYFL